MKGGFRISDDIRLKFLAKVQENKDILFGQFSDKLTKKDKIEKWTMILNYMHTIDYPLPPTADFTYIRDTVWQNFRKRVQGKYFKVMLGADGADAPAGAETTANQSIKNDVSGGVVVFNEIDKRVLEILNLDTTNLTFEDSSEAESPAVKRRRVIKHEPIGQDGQESNEEDFSAWLHQNSRFFEHQSHEGQAQGTNGVEGVENEEKLKLREIQARIEKTELEKELLHFQIEKAKLEVLLLTRKFGETDDN